MGAARGFLKLSLAVLMSVFSFSPDAGHPTAQQSSAQERLQALQSIPYISAPVDLSQQVGLLGMRESEVTPGLNLFANRYHTTAALMDNKGKIVHRWTMKDRSAWFAEEVTPDGDLLVEHGWDGDRHVDFPEERGFPSRLTKLSRDSKVLWSVTLPVHHDLQILPDGNLLVLLDRVRKTSGAHPVTIKDNTIAYLSPDGHVLREISLYDLVRRARFKLPFLKSDSSTEPWDLFHANTVRQLSDARSAEILRTIGATPATKRIYRSGNVLVCSRHQSFVAIVDPTRSEIVWMWGRGELEGPHSARLLASGNVMIFDNGLDRGWSRVVEVNPGTGKIVWNWSARKPTDFYVQTGGACQRLPTGNTLITDSWHATAIEVTPDKRIVWKWKNPDTTFMYRLRRYREDYFVPTMRQRLMASLTRK